jgi:hypothetical protein
VDILDPQAQILWEFDFIAAFIILASPVGFCQQALAAAEQPHVVDAQIRN